MKLHEIVLSENMNTPQDVLNVVVFVNEWFDDETQASISDKRIHQILEQYPEFKTVQTAYRYLTLDTTKKSYHRDLLLLPEDPGRSWTTRRQKPDVVTGLGKDAKLSDQQLIELTATVVGLDYLKMAEHVKDHPKFGYNIPDNMLPIIHSEAEIIATELFSVEISNICPLA